MRIERIVVDRDESGAWRFRVEHTAGVIYCPGFASALAAIEALATDPPPVPAPDQKGKQEESEPASAGAAVVHGPDLEAVAGAVPGQARPPEPPKGGGVAVDTTPSSV